jgi:tryptophan 2,3-dioxygenase
MHHVTLVQRVIGGGSVGTQGTPVELLEGLIKRRLFPELWETRNRLTEIAKAEGG